GVRMITGAAEVCARLALELARCLMDGGRIAGYVANSTSYRFPMVFDRRLSLTINQSRRIDWCEQRRAVCAFQQIGADSALGPPARNIFHDLASVELGPLNS